MAVGLTPRYHQDIDLGNLTAHQFLALAVETAKKENWNISFVSENGFMAYTNNGMFAWNGLVKLKVSGTTANLLSESTGSDMIDMGKNRKNLASFIAAFEALKPTFSPEQLTTIYSELSTQFVAKEEDILILPPPSTKEKFVEFFSIFKPIQGYFITPILLNLNILLFIIQLLTGVSIIEPDNDSLLLWGGNFRPLTLNGEWWRLITCCFLHIGVVHLLFNMYALLYVGVLLEPLLGRARFLTAYLLTGIASSAVSLWWHDLTISAGASGAIFGMYGVFLAMLTTNLIEKAQRQSLMASIGVFVGYNLLFGLKGNTDNSGHIGGLISGLIIGYAYYPSLIKFHAQKLKLATIAGVTVLVLGGSFLFYANTSNDFNVYQTKMDEFTLLENKALQAFDTSKIRTGEQQIEYIRNTGIPAWKEGIELIKKSDDLDIPEQLHLRNSKLINYTELRLKYYELILSSMTENTDKYNKEIDETLNDLNAVLEELNKM